MLDTVTTSVEGIFSSFEQPSEHFPCQQPSREVQSPIHETFRQSRRSSRSSTSMILHLVGTSFRLCTSMSRSPSKSTSSSSVIHKEAREVGFRGLCESYLEVIAGREGHMRARSRYFGPPGGWKWPIDTVA